MPGIGQGRVDAYTGKIGFSKSTTSNTEIPTTVIPEVQGQVARQVAEQDGDIALLKATVERLTKRLDDRVETIVLSLSGTVTTGTNKIVFRMPFSMAATEVRASVTTASSSGSIVLDINEDGASILSNPLSIDVFEKSSKTSSSPVVIADAVLADDSQITVDVDSAGTNAADLKIYLLGRILNA